MAIYDYNTLGLKNMLDRRRRDHVRQGRRRQLPEEVRRARRQGVARVGAGKDTTDFNSIITNAKASNPDGVYYGGVVDLRWRPAPQAAAASRA